MRARANENCKDRLLVDQLKSGSREAFDEIFRLYLKRVYRQGLRLTGRELDAEDVVQEVFLNVYKKIKTFRGQSQFETWLYRLTINAALMKLRSNKRRREVFLCDYLPWFQKDRRHQIRPEADWFHQVDDPSKRHELQQLLGRALNELGPRDRAIILMSDLEGYTDREIAGVFDLSLSAVKTRLHRARLFLRGKFECSTS